MYTVRLAPADYPLDTIDITGFATPREAWNELLTQLEQDQDAYAERGLDPDGVASQAYQEAIDATLGRRLNQTGRVSVETGDKVTYSVIRQGSFDDIDPPIVVGS